MWERAGSTAADGCLAGRIRVSLHNVPYATSIRRVPAGPGLRQFLPLLGLALSVLLTSPAPAASDAERLGQLPNGARYWIAANHASPMVGAVCVVHAGSGTETAETQGASHFLEHLLFNGTERRSQEELYAAFDRLSVYHNATTRPTHVALFILSPRDSFWRAFRLQVEMAFRSTLPAEKLEKERGIILEELAKDRASGQYDLETVRSADLFGESSYGRPTLGTESSIESLTRAQIASFYERFYRPGNTSWVLIGDVDAGAAQDSLRAILGEIEGRPGETAVSPPPPGSRPIVRSHRLPGDESSIRWSWLGPDPGSAEFLPFLARAELWASGDGSPLGAAWLARSDLGITGYAGSVAEYPGFSLLQIEVSLSPETSAATVLQAAPRVMEASFAAPADARGLHAWKVRTLADEEYLREKPHYYGILRADEIAARGLEAVSHRRDAALALAWDEVRRVALPPATLPVSVSVAVSESASKDSPLPGDPDLAPFPTLPPWPAGAAGDADTAELLAELRQGVTRSGSGGAAGALDSFQLSNGLTVLLRSTAESPVLALHLFVTGRSAAEPRERAGLAELLHQMLGEGPAVRSSAAWRASLEAMGAELKTADDPAIPYDDLYSTPEFTFVRFQSLDAFADSAVTAFASLLAHPRFEAAVFDRAKQSMLTRAGKAATSSRVSVQRLLRASFPDSLEPDDLFGRRETIEPVTLDEVRAFAVRYLDPRASLLVVATGLPRERMQPLLERALAGWPAPSTPIPEARAASGLRRLWSAERTLAADELARARQLSMERPAPARAEAARVTQMLGVPAGADLVVLADSLGGPQGSLTLRQSIDAPIDEAPRLEVVNAILSDRLGFQLREREALAYSLGANLEPRRGGGFVWRASAAARPASLDRLAQGFAAAADSALSYPPSPDEVERAAGRLYGRGVMRRATRMNWAYAAGLAWLHGLNPEDLDRRETRLRAVRADEVVDATKRYWVGTPRLIAVCR